MEPTKEELNEILEDATAEFNSVGAKFDRLMELDKQGKHDCKEYQEISISLLDE